MWPAVILERGLCSRIHKKDKIYLFPRPVSQPYQNIMTLLLVQQEGVTLRSEFPDSDTYFPLPSTWRQEHSREKDHILHFEP